MNPGVPNCSTRSYGPCSSPVQNFRGGRCFSKQSLQYTGRPSVGLNGTSQSLPQSAHFAGCISRGPPKPPLRLSPLSPNSMFLTLYVLTSPSRIMFAYCAPLRERHRSNRRPRWFVFEYNIFQVSKSSTYRLINRFQVGAFPRHELSGSAWPDRTHVPAVATHSCRGPRIERRPRLIIHHFRSLHIG